MSIPSANTIQRTRYTLGGNTDRNPIGAGFWTRTTLSRRDDDIKIILNAITAKSPNIITRKLYGRDNLMWLIWLYNNILDPVDELFDGKVIYLPNPSRVI